MTKMINEWAMDTAISFLNRPRINGRKSRKKSWLELQVGVKEPCPVASLGRCLL